MRSGPLCTLLWRILTWCSRKPITLKAWHMVSCSRGFPDDMQQVSPASGRTVCYEVQQQGTSVCFTSSRLPSLGSGCSQLALGWSGPLYLPTSSHSGQSCIEIKELLCRKIILISPGWPSTPWFWDLVAMSSQVPVCLLNLLTQPFSQISHKNLSNLNLHAWILVPQLSRNKASLSQWQHKLSLLKEAQSDQSTQWSGPFIQNGAGVIRWT